MVNLRYLQALQLLQGFDLLPLFYVLPQPLVIDRKMDKFPRNPFVAVTTPRWRDLYNTVGWQAEVADLWALTIWPYLGIRGGISNYSHDDPFVRLAYSLPLWRGLLAYVGVSLETLAQCPDNGEVPYKSENDTDAMCKDLAKLFWNHPALKMKPMLKIVRAHRTHEDYAQRKSTVRIDFYRKYYHTRTKHGIPVSVEQMQENAENPTLLDYTLDDVLSSEWVEKFYGWLGNRKDVEICKLLNLGLKQKQIAARLGYANHSGVNKRIALIRDMLERFVEWQRELEEPPPASPEASSIRYDIIPFTYTKK